MFLNTLSYPFFHTKSFNLDNTHLLVAYGLHANRDLKLPFFKWSITKSPLDLCLINYVNLDDIFWLIFLI